MMSKSKREEYNLLKKRYDDALYKSSQWEYSLENRYTEDQQLDIISMVSYWCNQLRGFGHLNDEKHMQSILEEDINGILYQEAKIGFEYSKACTVYTSDALLPSGTSASCNLIRNTNKNKR